ncbi:MAG: hypothetical protein Q4G33_02105 [bacterium]|nr:hypothetical protein [bacterium]
MEDILLIIMFAVVIIYGYFVIGAVGKFLAENYKGFEQDEYCEEEEKNDENIDIK